MVTGVNAVSTTPLPIYLRIVCLDFYGAYALGRFNMYDIRRIPWMLAYSRRASAAEEDLLCVFFVRGFGPRRLRADGDK